MSFDFSTLFWIFIVIMVLQPLFTARWYWLISPDGQETIANYKIDGQQLFYPNANDPNA